MFFFCKQINILYFSKNILLDLRMFWYFGLKQDKNLSKKSIFLQLGESFSAVNMFLLSKKKKQIIKGFYMGHF